MSDAGMGGMGGFIPPNRLGGGKGGKGRFGKRASKRGGRKKKR